MNILCKLYLNGWGKVDNQILKNSWQCVINHYQILKSGFIWKHLDQPIQYTKKKQTEVPWEFYNWCDIPKDEHSEYLSSLLKLDRKFNFDLSKAPLLRMMMIQISINQHYLIWSNHHILIRWSSCH